ncbi:MAG: DUF2852 domain-containing protein [Acidisphaera sp.]|nr:DUF2852 domain-containing protein [Acidisphaera sp.]
MSSTAQDRYGDAVWGPGPQRTGPPWSAGPDWGLPFGARPLWVAITILSFLVWWPLGLAVLFFLLGSGRMGCGRHRRRNGFDRRGRGSEAPPWSAPWSSGWRSFCGGEQSRSTGNHAFDEYRADTLRRLEEEQREFSAFLDRLRLARDKAEFDAFMAERRQRPTEPPAPEPAPG